MTHYVMYSMYSTLCKRYQYIQWRRYIHGIAQKKFPIAYVQQNKPCRLLQYNLYQSLYYSTVPKLYQCLECGQEYAKWQGQCTSCEKWGEVKLRTSSTSMFSQKSDAIANKINGKIQRKNWIENEHFAHENQQPLMFRMDELKSTSTQRIPLPDRELNWVLSGGLVTGSLTLFAGSPGVGKSTLALQIAHMLCNEKDQSIPGDVLYVSGEESVHQVKLRADRMFSDVNKQLCVMNATNIDDILQFAVSIQDNNLEETSPLKALVIDSIQTMYTPEVPSAAGSVNQVKECTLRCLRAAKSFNLPIILIGHVTKAGDIAGPKVLEHIVDTVLQIDDASTTNSSPMNHDHRYIRCLKNRFGSTSEIGIFHMTPGGFQHVQEPLHTFLTASSQHNHTLDDGIAITIAMEGTRPIPIEIQVLTTSSENSLVRGVGISFDKLSLILAVLSKRTGLSTYRKSIFVNLAGGFQLASNETELDAAVAMAIASAVSGKPLQSGVICWGELSLSGHLRPVKHTRQRLLAAQRLGAKKLILPKFDPKNDSTAIDELKKFHSSYPTIEIIQVLTLREAIQNVLVVS